MQVVDVLNESQEGDFGRRNDLKKQGEWCWRRWWDVDPHHQETRHVSFRTTLLLPFCSLRYWVLFRWQKESSERRKKRTPNPANTLKRALCQNGVTAHLFIYLFFFFLVPIIRCTLCASHAIFFFAAVSG
jgi:hypothetical protein